MLTYVLASLVISQVFASTVMPTTQHAHHHHGSHATHAHHHVSREPLEGGSFAFKYDPHVHTMVAKVGKSCYTYEADATERTDVHTAHGLRTMEIKIITMVDSNEMGMGTISLSDLTTMSKILGHMCIHASAIYHLN